MTGWELQRITRMMNDIRKVKCVHQQYKAFTDEVVDAETDDEDGGELIAEQYPSNISHPDGMYGF